MIRPRATSRRFSSSAPNADAAATPTSPSARASSSPGATKALGGLSAQSLVEVVDRDVRLTQRGLGVARSTLDKYEFFRRLLCDAGVHAHLAAREACRLEHCISAPSFRRLADHLANMREEDRDG